MILTFIFSTRIKREKRIKEVKEVKGRNLKCHSLNSHGLIYVL